MPPADHGTESQGSPRAVLGRSVLFAGADPATLDCALASATQRKLPAGAVLFRQGDAPTHLFVLTSGRVKVGQVSGAGSPLTIGFMGPGDPVGCVAVFRQVPYPATAMAVTDIAALAWPASAVASLLERIPQISANALNMVGARTEEMVNRLREMATERVEMRIAKTLLRLGETSGNVAESGLEIGFLISRQDVAEMAGTDLYNVSRVLSRWKREGLIDSRRQRITIRHPSGLSRIASGTE